MADAPVPIDPSQQPQNPYQMPPPGGGGYAASYPGYGTWPGSTTPQGPVGVPAIPSMNENGIGVSQNGLPGDPVSGVNMNYGGTPINLQNPGMMDPSRLNPYAAGYLNDINGLASMFGASAAGGAFNPDFYQHMQDTSQANLVTGVENSYARAGLSGSSAAMGGVSNAIEKNQMDWLNRQQSDQMRSLQGLEGIDKLGMSSVMGVQGQYGDFQDTYNQDMLSLLGVNEQKNASNNQMIGQGLSSIAQIGMAAAFLI